MKQTALLLSVLLLLSVFLCSCKQDKKDTMTPTAVSTIPQASEPTEPVHFDTEEVSFVLPGDFTDFTDSPFGQRYDFAYACDFVGVVGISQEKNQEADLAAYAAAYAAEKGSEAVQKDGFWSVTYEDLTQNEPQTFVCAFYETENKYWTVESYCPSILFENYAEDMWSYVISAKFN